MLFDDVYLVSPELHLVALDDVRNLENYFRVDAPLGYAKFVTTLGLGEYCGNINIFSPIQILEKYKEYRQKWRDAFFWDEDVLTRTQVFEAIILGKTNNGDEYIYYPPIAKKIFILPRQDDRIFFLPDGLIDPLNWKSTYNTDEYYDQPAFRFFLPYGKRKIINLSSHGVNQSFDAIVQNITTYWNENIRFSPFASGVAATQIFVSDIAGSIKLIEFSNKSFSIRIDLDPNFDEIISQFIRVFTRTAFDVVGEQIYGE